jgi:transposase
MAIPYSQDLRIRVLNLLCDGIKISTVSRMLKISRPTIYRWKKQLETQGRTLPLISVPPPQSSKIQNWQEFAEFIDNNSDKTQKELAQMWGGVSHHTISRGLKKLGYTRKKKHMVIKSVMKKHDVNLEIKSKNINQNS